MGPNQSKNTAGRASDADVKTSYYELLGVERQATDTEIKKAYRLRALDLHPDRNYGAEEEATKKFSEIQAAYEVLSDPQERAWYDSHESAILRGAEGGDTEEHYEHDVKVTTADEITAMMGKFNGRVDFSDSPNGFYGFLREVFEKLAKEEEVSAEWENTDVPDYPSFGHKDDDYEDVVKKFYAAWAGFQTKKTFAWKDRYRYQEAPDRRVRRMMEKENKSFREQGIREFNDAIRNLVHFVRKRDPRYTPNLQTDWDRNEALAKASAAQAARARAANAAKMTEAVPQWTKIEHEKEEEALSEEEEEVEEYECVACRKTFKSEKQWEAHEKSKKHQKSIQTLKWQMRKDNARLGLDKEAIDNDHITPMDDEDEDDSSDVTLAEEEADLASEVEDLDLDDESQTSEVEGEDVDSTIPSQTPIDKSNTSESDSDQDDDYAPREKVADRLTSSSTNIELPKDPNTAEPPLPEKKLGKAALKRLKKASKEPESTSSAEFQCVNCAAEFPSKNKLYSHLKDNPKHAAAPTAVKGKGKGRKK